jgi:membrane associated rhomboid family serine protease
MLNVPPGCAALILIIIVTGFLQLMLGYHFDDYAFRPIDFIAAPLAPHSIMTLLSYQFLHANLLHLGVNSLMLLAFGSAMNQMVGTPRFILFYLISGIVAALAHMVVYPGGTSALVGASGAISGVMGFVLWHILRQPNRCMTLMMMLVIQPLLAWAAGDMLGGEIAWVAHLAGFAFGIVAAIMPKVIKKIRSIDDAGR